MVRGAVVRGPMRRRTRERPMTVAGEGSVMAAAMVTVASSVRAMVGVMMGAAGAAGAAVGRRTLGFVIFRRDLRGVVLHSIVILLGSVCSRSVLGVVRRRRVIVSWARARTTAGVTSSPGTAAASTTPAAMATPRGIGIEGKAGREGGSRVRSRTYLVDSFAYAYASRFHEAEEVCERGRGREWVGRAITTIGEGSGDLTLPRHDCSERECVCGKK